jgi:hypothetical protein
MAARFGEVVYWTACGLAAVFMIVGIVVFAHDGELAAGVVGGITFALPIWLAGRACLYVLAGR